MICSFKCMKLNVYGMLVIVLDYQCSYVVKFIIEEKCNIDIECLSKQICKYIYDMCYILVWLDFQLICNKFFRII